MQLRPSADAALEAAVRTGLDLPTAHPLEAFGRQGNVSVLLQFARPADGTLAVAKTIPANSPFPEHHARECDFYTHTRRPPCRGVSHAVSPAVIHMDLLTEGRVPDQMAGMCPADVRRVLDAAAAAHATLQPWPTLGAAADVVLGFAHRLAAPLLPLVTPAGVRALGLCPGREDAACALMHATLRGWDALTADLVGSAVVHGDLRGENVFLPDNVQSEAVLLDWQMVCVGSPAIDIAYLLASSMRPDDRAAHERELVGGVCPVGVSKDEFFQLYRRALRWPVVWAVFVCGGGVDEGTPGWEYHVTVAERFLCAALDTL